MLKKVRNINKNKKKTISFVIYKFMSIFLLKKDRSFERVVLSRN